MKKKEIFLLNVIAAIIFLMIIFGVCALLSLLNFIASLVNPIWIIVLICCVVYKFLNIK